MIGSRSSSETGLRVIGLLSGLAGPFTFDVAAGHCLAITGPSGSGKSLLLRLVADLDPGTGEVLLAGHDRASMSARAWRSKCPYVAATPAFWERRAGDHFAPEQQARARALAEEMMFDVSRFDAPVEMLSSGERQRIALIRALLMDSAALLLDEPTGPLDDVASSAVAGLLAKRLEQGLSLMIVTHDERLAARLGSERREMRDRKLME